MRYLVHTSTYIQIFCFLEISSNSLALGLKHSVNFILKWIFLKISYRQLKKTNFNIDFDFVWLKSIVLDFIDSLVSSDLLPQMVRLKGL